MERMTLNSRFTSGAFIRMTLQEAIDKDVTAVDNLKNLGIIKIDADALCHLINKRSEKECAFGRRVQKMEEKNA